MSTVVAYLADDTTLASAGVTLTPNPIVAGDESNELVLHLWCAKGSPGAAASGPLSLYEVVKNALNQYVSSGMPCVDQGWVMAKLGGIDNDSDPQMLDASSEWMRLSAGQPILVPSISADCARYLTLKLAAPQNDGATSETVNLQLRQVHDEPSAPMLGAVAREAFGILTQIGDLTYTGLIDLAPPDTWPGTRAWAAIITPSGSPDAIVHVGWRKFATRGIPFWEEPTDLTLNQTSASGALTAGQEYRAVITQPWGGGAAVATKGNRATAGVSTFPAVPASSSVIGWVKVSYEGGGTSVIEAADITVTTVPGRFRPWTEGALVLKVGAGIARAGGLTLWNLDSLSVTLDDSTTSYVWRSASGLSVTATATPAVAGDLLLCIATTAGGVITVIQDCRPFWEPNSETIRLYYDGTEATGPFGGMVAQAGKAYAIDRVGRFSLSTASTGTGSTVLDINRRRAGTSTTIFTNQAATIESRPKIAATAYGAENAMPEVTTLRPDDFLTVDCDTASSDLSAAGLGLALVVYPISYQ